MGRLSYRIKYFIVVRLAHGDTLNEVVTDVKKEFGIEVTRQQCEAYDPTKRIAVNLGEKWKTLFWTERKKQQMI